MKDNITDQQMVEHCAKLLWGYNWAQSNSSDESVERVHDDTEGYDIPKGLCDEDKFLCALFTKSNNGCLTSEVLWYLYGWTKYKARKIRKRIPFLNTVTCFCEDACGYCGRAWDFSYEFDKSIRELKKLNKPCIECATFMKSKFDPWYKCPVSHYRVEWINTAYCDHIKLVMDDEFKNFWK